jgi:hypothetical protein
MFSYLRATVVTFLISAAAPAMAQSNLLEQGSQFLKGLGSSVGSTLSGGGGGLGNDEIIAGLKEALKVGTGTVVDQLGARDGFNGDKEVHIPLPDKLQSVRKALAPFGMAGLLDDLEVRLNRAAEDATPKAKKVLWDAISDMSVEDAKKIYEGPDDAATKYFQGKMTKPLGNEWRPIVDKSLADVGAIKAYDEAIGEYSKLPFVPDVKSDLSDYVIELGLGGVFKYLAREEAEIRNNPVKRSTELLKKVFGN